MNDKTSPSSEPDHEDFQILMMGYLDGELKSEDQATFVAHLNQCDRCTKELSEYRRLNELASSVRLREPQDFELDRFWASIYNRMERKTGWLLVLFGVAIVSVAVAITIVRTDLLPLWVKLGIGGVAGGMLVLFVSVLRARLRTLPHDRYREVHR